MKLNVLKAIFLSSILFFGGFDGLSGANRNGASVAAQCYASPADWQGLGVNLGWQRNNNYQSLYNARCAFSNGNYGQAYQWVCYGQRHNGAVVAAYARCVQSNPNQFWYTVSMYW